MFVSLTNRARAGQALGAVNAMKAGQKFCLDLDWNLLKVFHSIVEANGGRLRRMRCGASSRRSVPLFSGSKESRQEMCRRGPAGFALTEEGRILYECVSELLRQGQSNP